jgi:hypothetical protein
MYICIHFSIEDELIGNNHAKQKHVRNRRDSRAKEV